MAWRCWRWPGGTEGSLKGLEAVRMCRSRPKGAEGGLEAAQRCRRLSEGPEADSNVESFGSLDTPQMAYNR